MRVPLRYTLILALILLFAAVVYLADINRVSFWEDESWMAIAIRGNLVDLWRFAAERGVHPPLYFYLGWLFVRFTGDGELALRWLAGLCALVGVAFTARLGADWFGRRAGVFAALLTAGSLFLIYFGRLARHYTLFFALAAALVWAYERWRTASGRRRVRWLVALALLQAGLLYSHYFGVWMLPVLALHGLFTLPRREWLKLLAALAVSSVLFLPWVPAVIGQLKGGGSGLGYAIQDAGSGLRAYTDRVFNGDYALGAVLLLLGGLALWKNRRWNAGGLLILWLTLPLGLSLLLNTRFVWFVERNMIFTLPGAYILLGAGLAWIGRNRPGRAAATAAAVLFAALGLVNYDVFWPYVTPDWRSLAGAMAVESRPDDVFVLRGEPYSLDYYLRRDLNAPVTITRPAEWLAHTGDPARVWLVDANWAVQDEARAALPADAIMTRQIILGVLDAEFYQATPGDFLTVYDGQIGLGYRGERDLTAAPGATLALDLWWRALRQPDEDYSVGIYLIAPDGHTQAQQDGGFDQRRVPALLLPQDRWTPDARSLVIPVDTPPGDYTLTVAVYDWHNNQRILPENAREDGAFALASVRIAFAPGG